MFCDLVQSSLLGERLDPEDLRQVIGSYHETCAKVIDQFQGHVAQYLGDGVLAYFSYPQAHEDDAERAVRAGLSTVSELEQIVPRMEAECGVRLGVRIGIHTGDVVMGELGSGRHRETLALGHTVNLAARLQGEAEPGSVVISGETARLVRGLFVTRDLGTRSLAGIADPVPVYRVVHPSGVRSRLDVTGAAGLTPLVGRERDLATLFDRWNRASKGRGQVVLVGGEAGIGKSRLLYALRDRLADTPHTWLECHGSPYHENSALYPVIELLRQGLRITTDESADQQAAKIERGLARLDLPLPEIVPLFTALLSVPLPEQYAPLSLSPEGQRRKTLEALATWLFALARLQPAVLAIEDLHWSDPSSMELLGMLIEQAETAPVLLLATFRPTFEPPWPPRSGLTRTSVGPLSRQETADMARGIAAARALPPAVLDQVVEKTDGVPLFIEELTNCVLESAPMARGEDGQEEAVSPPDLAIPSTLQDSLAARLDRLGPAKDVAQLAAVLGREFSYELLAAVSTADAPLLEERLAQLAVAELVYQSVESVDRPNVSYSFKHALIQEAAYQSLLKSTRRAQHQRIARVLEERFPVRVESEPEEIARHCEAGGLIEQAISYYQRAAELAMKRSANWEAVGHLTRGIGLLGKLPECPERDEQELVLQVSLGAPLVAAKGWGTREAKRAYARARELCEWIGEAPQLFQVVRGLVTFYVAQAELEAAHGLCERLLRLAGGEPDPSARVVAHQHMAIVLYFKGDLSAALEHYERGSSLNDPPEDRSLPFLYGEDLGVSIRIWMAWDLWLLGYPDKARGTGHAAVELGVKAAHPFSHAYALLWTSIVHVMRREHERARELAEAAIAISEEQGFAFLLGGSRLIRGWARFDPRRADAEIEQAIVEFRQGLDQLSKVDNRVCAPQILGYLAAIYRDVGRVEEALETVDAALAMSKTTHQSYWDAELHRIKGETLLQKHGEAHAPAERLFHRALEVSRHQQARSLELRAAMSLCRLWQKRGTRSQARALLAPIYDWFTEGFETADLKEAKELLDELS